MLEGNKFVCKLPPKDGLAIVTLLQQVAATSLVILEGREGNPL